VCVHEQYSNYGDQRADKFTVANYCALVHAHCWTEPRGHCGGLQCQKAHQAHPGDQRSPSRFVGYHYTSLSQYFSPFTVEFYGKREKIIFVQSSICMHYIAFFVRIEKLDSNEMNFEIFARHFTCKNSSSCLLDFSIWFQLSWIFQIFKWIIFSLLRINNHIFSSMRIGKCLYILAV